MATEVECGDASRYCPANTHIPIDVSQGYYTSGATVSTRVNQTIAPIGHYAIRGLLYKCPAGYYGATQGLTDPSCTGKCMEKGYYCQSLALVLTKNFVEVMTIFVRREAELL